MAPENQPILTEEAVLGAVIQLGFGGFDLRVDQEFCGGQCSVYKPSFLNHPSLPYREYLALRTPIHMADRDAIVCALEREI